MRRFASHFLVGSVVFMTLVTTIHCGSSTGSGFDTGDGDGGGVGGDSGKGLGSGDASHDGAAVVVDKCHVPPDSTSGNAANCTTPAAPPNSFTPVLKWKWDDPDPGSEGVWVIPLVANLTDDDKSGQVNLCDIPDVVVETAGTGEYSRSGKLYMLSGKDGSLESTFGGVTVDGDATPALADLDGDGVPEIIAVNTAGNITIFGNDGNVKLTGDVAEAISSGNDFYQSCSAIAVYDLDADGTPEIIYGFEVFDNKGHKKWSAANVASGYYCLEPTAADLDGDGKLEVIWGNAAYHHDGTLYWQLPGSPPPGAPQVANLDSDPLPEILVARQDGILVLENDGTVKFGPVQPFDPGVSNVCWAKAAAIHDFDGDGHPDLATSSCAHYGVFNIGATGLTQLWLTPINDGSGIASSTAFDFLGRGYADAVYGDQVSLQVWAGKTGTNELSQARSSGTIIEFPIVADVDNDNSADILVVSNNGAYPALQVFEDQGKRWIPTRRIWNQHAYHVTNVREDGTIPQHMQNSWSQLNTFRTNAEIENGGTCAPPVPAPR
ncbi:MAG: VCBS repeat-containing protein [Polyangiaceae bacterium]